MRYPTVLHQSVPDHHPAMSFLHTLVMASFATLSMAKLESTCETLPSKIHITKEDFSKDKELMRTCEDDVEINKCEGSCVSTTMPSARERWDHNISSFLTNHKCFRSGFSKDCSCCRESSYNEKTLTLHNCYDQDGHKLEGSLAQMQEGLIMTLY